MIAVEPIHEIIELSVVSGLLSDEKTVSSLIVAEPESFKTEIIMRFQNYPNIMILGDINISSLIEEILPSLMNTPQVTHILIPDFLKVIQKKSVTASNTLNLLNQLTEEGLFNISYRNRVYDFKGLRVGLITALTQGVMTDKRRSFWKTGFLSRCIPISYQYSMETYKQITEYTLNQNYLDTIPVPLELIHPLIKEGVKKRVYGDTTLFRHFLPIVQKHRELEHTYGFRFLKHLQRIACASAYLDGRNRVRKEDISRIIRLSEYMNLDYKEI